MGKLACIGIVVADFIVKPVVKIPAKGALTLVDTAELHTGGCASNTGVIAAKLGAGVSIFGKVGEDALGEFVIAALGKSGVETRDIKKQKGLTTSGTAVFVHADGERSFIHSFGANAQLSRGDVALERLQDFSLVHLAGVFLLPGLERESLAGLCEDVKRAGKTLTLDTAWDSSGEWLPKIEASLKHLDYFLPSYEEAKMLTGLSGPEEICRFFLERGVKNVGLKMGPEGSFIMNGREKHHYKPLPVNVVDATGAGDAYAAGFLTGLLKGYTFEQCGLVANLTGAQAVTAVGATSGISDWQALAGFAGGHGFSLP